VITTRPLPIQIRNERCHRRAEFRTGRQGDPLGRPQGFQVMRPVKHNPALLSRGK
jgi:hypothetical protein